MGTHHLKTSSIRKQLDIRITTMKLLRRIREQICPATQAWNAFLLPGGGLDSFKDLEDRIYKASLRDIKHALSELIELEQALLSMTNSLQESATIVSHHEYLQNRVDFDVA